MEWRIVTRVGGFVLMIGHKTTSTIADMGLPIASLCTEHVF